jgi:hypothetical protein
VGSPVCSGDLRQAICDKPSLRFEIPPSLFDISLPGVFAFRFAPLREIFRLPAFHSGLL